MFPDTNLKVHMGHSLALLGPNGGGKTTLGRALVGRLPSVKGHAGYHLPFTRIAYVSFQSHLKLANNTDDPYLQQRWNSFDAETAPTVQQAFWPGQETLSGEVMTLLEAFHATQLLKKRNIHLSNGELRKVELIRAFSRDPWLMVIDNAFVGLDAESRVVLAQTLEQLSGHCTLVLTALRPEAIPDFVEERICCEDMQLTARSEQAVSGNPVADPPTQLIAPKKVPDEAYVEMAELGIAYDETRILKGINWRIQPGEHWALIGPNGSGKSTLLSLIVADNPQAYARNLRLFGKKKGSGETIWDIKRRLGFISPELHQFVPRDRNLQQFLVQDMAWLYPGIDRNKVLEDAKAWMAWFELDRPLNMPFGYLSSGEQRLLLLVRCLLYPFDLLIADEPCQGLDDVHVERVRRLFDQLAAFPHIATVFVTHRPEELPSRTKLTFDLREENEAIGASRHGV